MFDPKIKKVNNYYLVLELDTIYTCETENDLIDLLNNEESCECSMGICSETFENEIEAKKEFEKC